MPDSERPEAKRVEEPDDEPSVAPLERWLLRAMVLVLDLVTRLGDLAVLLLRPRLLRPFFVHWFAELVKTPYKWSGSFEAVQAARAIGQRRGELLYGETPVITGIWLFSRAGVGKGSCLLDIGSGRGRALLAAKWLGARSRGVELDARHVRLMERAMRRVGIELVAGDALREDLSEVTHVFLNWCAFSEATKAKLVERFATCRPRTSFIAVTRPIDAPGFETVRTTYGLFSWGPERVWIQRRQ